MEKRIDQRYDIPLRAVLSFTDAPTRDFETSNISAGGAFFKADHPCLEGSEVFMTLFREAASDETDPEGGEAFMSLFDEAMSYENMLAVNFKARIVRCYNNGIAVSFNRDAA